MKLDNAAGSNKYYVSNKRTFAGALISKEAIQTVIAFAYEMCFGSGHHRNCRTGGQYDRKGGEKFCNAFQGKLAEIVLYNYFKSEDLDVKEPDFGIYKKGVWDDSDLEIRGKKINVKSAAFQSNLLLLETKDWNLQGQYIPNMLLNNGATVQYDYFVLVRIEPDIKKLFKAERLLLSSEIERKIIDNILFANNWYFDIAGYCTNADLITSIASGNVLPQNAMLNQYTKMDASNYYIQSGEMKCVKDLIQELKAI
nr:hypothetical protein [uncultured Flavobacterium sp.]